MSDTHDREPGAGHPARHLTLMPEVLPAPQEAGHGAARTRTLAHLQRVMASVAAATALGVACGRLPADQPVRATPTAAAGR